MMSRRSILLSTVSCMVILGTCFATRNSCIRVETYQTTTYSIRPFDNPSRWFMHRPHYSTQLITRIGVRTKRLFGCCEPGYTFGIIQCEPHCSTPCPENASCTSPDTCTCKWGFTKGPNATCVSTRNAVRRIFAPTTVASKTDQTTTPTMIASTISMTTPTPCNNSCSSNEECFPLNNTCICKHDCHPTTVLTTTSTISTTTLNSVPTCEPECQHADCTQPNVCTCWPHYIRFNDTTCHLECTESSCIYGECDESGRCVCAPNFISNGTACLWAGDAIQSQPDDCDCWANFVWRRNESSRSRVDKCIPLCDGDDSIEVTSGCINVKQCLHSEEYTICGDLIYKCYPWDVNEQSTTGHYPLQVTQDPNTSAKMTISILAFLGVILVIGGLLLLWKKRKLSLRNLWNYNRMENPQEH